mmetsp:Transcript_98026/g.315382  ORF Transcript_98026/g.315382 Transcript_98026/m.315382 type:complete len:80 (+) Transcript_98026:3-242(+)
MKNKFDMWSLGMLKKSKAAPGVKALKRRPGKRREEKEEKKAEEMEMHAPGVEVGGMQLEERIVCAADLTEEEKSKWITW